MLTCEAAVGVRVGFANGKAPTRSVVPCCAAVPEVAWAAELPPTVTVRSVRSQAGEAVKIRS